MLKVLASLPTSRTMACVQNFNPPLMCEAGFGITTIGAPACAQETVIYVSDGGHGHFLTNNMNVTATFTDGSSGELPVLTDEFENNSMEDTRDYLETIGVSP